RSPKTRRHAESVAGSPISRTQPRKLTVVEAASTEGITPPIVRIAKAKFGHRLAQLPFLRNNFGLVAFGQMYRVDTRLLRKLFEQSVKTVLIDSMVLHAFGLLRYLCDQTLQLLRRVFVFEVLERGQTAAGAAARHSGGSPAAYCAAE